MLLGILKLELIEVNFSVAIAWCKIGHLRLLLQLLRGCKNDYAEEIKN